MKKVVSILMLFSILILLFTLCVFDAAFAQTTITIISTEVLPGNPCLTKENCSDGKVRLRVNKDGACKRVNINQTTNQLEIIDGTCDPNGYCQ